MLLGDSTEAVGRRTKWKSPVSSPLCQTSSIRLFCKMFSQTLKPAPPPPKKKPSFCHYMASDLLFFYFLPTGDVSSLREIIFRLVLSDFLSVTKQMSTSKFQAFIVSFSKRKLFLSLSLSISFHFRDPEENDGNGRLFLFLYNKKNTCTM